MGGSLDERVDAEEPVGFGRIGFEAGGVTTQLDHDAVGVEVVQRMAPPVVLLHRRFDALGRHPGSNRFLLLGRCSERTVVHPEGQPDALGHGFGMIDIHDPKGSGYTTWMDQNESNMVLAGESYHIPLGMCLNETFDNLAVAGRCASATHEGQASVRLQTHCMVMGQGVGTAAAMAIDAAQAISQVDPAKLQEKLRRDGAYIEQVP